MEGLADDSMPLNRYRFVGCVLNVLIIVCTQTCRARVMHRHQGEPIHFISFASEIKLIRLLSPHTSTKRPTKCTPSAQSSTHPTRSSKANTNGFAASS
jgi:hypothetical protein